MSIIAPTHNIAGNVLTIPSLAFFLHNIYKFMIYTIVHEIVAPQPS